MRRLAAAGLVAVLLAPAAAQAQRASMSPMEGPATEAAPFGPPVDDQRTYVHGLLSEFEGRFGADTSFRWEGEGWVGGDFDRLWLKSEGEVTHGRVEDGQQELYWSRPISTYFDAQLGGRYDLDDAPGRGWAALGVEGFAPYYFTVGAHAYVGDGGRAAFKLEGSNEIRFTQRLIMEPQAELNIYTQDDPARAIGTGPSDLDAGLRLRYEISRKFAPYAGLTYERKFGRTADYARAEGERVDDLRFTLGVRSWF
ncbi:MAG: copper resistance protein B [Caulobacteraceae bacterium]|nr:copper resistance protein B [Caulobacter sp.]